MKYEQPILEIIKIEITDVIMTSGLTDGQTGTDLGKDFGDTGW